MNDAGEALRRPPAPPVAGADLLAHGAVHRAFAAVAAAAPERRAVAAGAGGPTYGELARRAHRIAHRLAAAGGDRDRPVLLLLEPGPDLAAAMLGVLAAGRFFVALDPVSPAERNRWIAADSEARRAVTCARLAPRLAGLRGIDVVELDGLRPDPAESAPPAAAAATGLDDLAALTYTSGSTGRPKGVMQSHRTVLHNVGVTRDALGVTADDRVTLLYPPSVNPALRDTFTALFCGATLAPFLVTVDGLPALAAWLARESVSVLCCGVTLFRELVPSLPPGDPLPAVRAVKLGGEPVTAAEIAAFRARFPEPCRLYFGLGTTETGTVTCRFFGHHEPLPDGIPLGRPAPDTEILLDPDAAGTSSLPGSGEVVVRSAFLSPGYWRDPELTARVFRPDAAGRRRYRTGDLARRRADGSLEHLGRADAQLKIRGQRVEIAEVERALRALPGVREAAAGTLPGPGGEPDLIGYLVAAGRGPLVRADLRRRLAAELPQPMVPRVFVEVPRLPVTPNGKLDRPALATMGGRELPAERSFAFPRDPIETRLCALWCEVLGHEVVGIDESFFDLGGDSLAAVTLFSEMERRFGRTLPLAGIFEAPTVADQAARLRDDLAATAPAPVITLTDPGRGAPLFCVPAVDGYPFVYLPLSRHLAGERALHVLSFPGLDGIGAPLRTVEELAAELVRRMREVQPEGPYHLLGHSFGGMLAYEMTRQLQAAGQRVASLALVDSHTRRAVGWSARRLRDLELAALRAGELWREAAAAAPRPSRRLVVVATTLWHTARRTVARRRHNTVVEHVIHEVRRVATSARKRYRLRGRLDLAGGRVVLFRAAPVAGQPRLWCRLVDSANGWARHFAGPLEVQPVPGDHITMLQEDNVGVLAAQLRRDGRPPSSA